MLEKSVVTETGCLLAQVPTIRFPSKTRFTPWCARPGQKRMLSRRFFLASVISRGIGALCASDQNGLLCILNQVGSAAAV